MNAPHPCLQATRDALAPRETGQVLDTALASKIQAAQGATVGAGRWLRGVDKAFASKIQAAQVATVGAGRWLRPPGWQLQSGLAATASWRMLAAVLQWLQACCRLQMCEATPHAHTHRMCKATQQTHKHGMREATPHAHTHVMCEATPHAHKQHV
eukprot:262630-Chlamydomonas_euryale.AAC.1